MSQIETGPFIHSTGNAPGWSLTSYADDYRHCRLVALAYRGETPPEIAATLTAGILSLRSDGAQIPISVAHEDTSKTDLNFPKLVRSSMGSMNGLAIPEVAGFEPLDTQAKLLEIFSKMAQDLSEGKTVEPLSIIITGPATEISQFFKAHPEFANRKFVKKIELMGGAVRPNKDGSRGNRDDFKVHKLLLKATLGISLKDNSQREWNVDIDPEAVAHLMTLDTDFILTPLDATSEVFLDTIVPSIPQSRPPTPAEQFMAVVCDNSRMATMKWRRWRTGISGIDP